jgi:hypothetical protein
MDKVHKHNSINTNTPSSESYRTERKRPIVKPRHRWEDGIRMALRDSSDSG